MKVLERNSNNINIATFWENCQLGKYNFDPDYQRPSDVWSDSKKSFLIDTILKNFPMIGLNLPLSSYNPYYNSTIPDTGIYYIYCRIKISGGGFSFSGVSAQVSL